MHGTHRGSVAASAASSTSVSSSPCSRSTSSGCFAKRRCSAGIRGQAADEYLDVPVHRRPPIAASVPVRNRIRKSVAKRLGRMRDRRGARARAGVPDGDSIRTCVRIRTIGMDSGGRATASIDHDSGRSAPGFERAEARLPARRGHARRAVHARRFRSAPRRSASTAPSSPARRCRLGARDRLPGDRWGTTGAGRGRIGTTTPHDCGRQRASRRVSCDDAPTALDGACASRPPSARSRCSLAGRADAARRLRRRPGF